MSLPMICILAAHQLRQDVSMAAQFSIRIISFIVKFGIAHDTSRIYNRCLKISKYKALPLLLNYL